MKVWHLQQQGGLGGHYAKWSELNKEKILRDITFMWNLKNIQNIQSLRNIQNIQKI